MAAWFWSLSYSHSQLDTIINYINNQEEHHKKKTFKEEYISFLQHFHIEFKTEYIFDDV